MVQKFAFKETRAKVVEIGLRDIVDTGSREENALK
jgi:hypothetical protein